MRLDSIVLNEQLSLTTARELGIDTAESFIINLDSGKDDDVLLASKRFDRIVKDKSEILDGIRRPFRLHQEDFAQAMGIPSENKYEKDNKNYLQRMFETLRGYSANRKIKSSGNDKFKNVA